MAYPGSLDDILATINWQEIPQVKGWSFETFAVKHVAEVEPHGWMMRHESGLVMLHSGDSGPCDELWRRVSECDLAIVEMGLPEYVDSDEHHKPSSIETLGRNNPETKIIVTHTYVDDGPEIISAQIPEHPANVIHAQDGNSFFWDGTKIIAL
jgi:ribonuclease BN (tRNA processing enzyme)